MARPSPRDAPVTTAARRSSPRSMIVLRCRADSADVTISRRALLPMPRSEDQVDTKHYERPDMVSREPFDPMREPRFTGLATFMRAPYAESLQGVDIGLIGVPTDIGVTNRPGARHGPREIRNASS